MSPVTGSDPYPTPSPSPGPDPDAIKIDPVYLDDAASSLRAASEGLDATADRLPEIPASSDEGSAEVQLQLDYVTQNTANLLQLIDGVAAALDAYRADAVACEEALCAQSESLFG